MLQLAIALDRGRMRLPVGFLITRMGLAPFTPAVADDLGVFGIRGDPLAMVLGASPPLAFRMPADALRYMELRWFE